MFELDKESLDLCTIITPFGKNKYLRLLMRLKCSPEEYVLSDIEDANIYIDDVGAFFDDWDHHVNLLATILRQLGENGLTRNPLKCDWAVKETDWLSYWLTPRGLKPWKKKIDAILYMDHPCSATELHMFISCINYYRDMWPSRAHILKLLTDQSGLKKRAPIKWTDEMQKAFDKCTCLWLQMLLQLIRTTIKGSMYTLMPLTSSQAHVLFKKEGRLPTSCKS